MDKSLFTATDNWQQWSCDCRRPQTQADTQNHISINKWLVLPCAAVAAAGIRTWKRRRCSSVPLSSVALSKQRHLRQGRLAVVVAVAMAPVQVQLLPRRFGVYFVHSANRRLFKNLAPHIGSRCWLQFLIVHRPPPDCAMRRLDAAVQKADRRDDTHHCNNNRSYNEAVPYPSQRRHHSTMCFGSTMFSSTVRWKQKTPSRLAFIFCCLTKTLHVLVHTHTHTRTHVQSRVRSPFTHASFLFALSFSLLRRPAPRILRRRFTPFVRRVSR